MNDDSVETQSGAASTELEEMKRFLRFSDDDVEALAAFRPHAAPHFEWVARRFYDRIREHEEAHAVLVDEAQVARLQASLCRWMERALTGPYDADYHAKTKHIGKIHVKVGLPHRYMFLAMGVIRSAFAEVLDRTEAKLEAGMRRRVDDALCKVFEMELTTMVQAYRDVDRERVQRAEEQRRSSLEQSLDRAERRYLNVVELAPVIVVGQSLGGELVLFNRAAEDATGFSESEVLGTHFPTRFLAHEKREEWPLLGEEEKSLDGLPPREIPILHRSGQARVVRWHFAFLPPRQGDDLRVLAVGIDVTVERSLGQKLSQTEKLASVGTLAAGLAHEIRNPLNGAQLHVTFLERGLKKQGIDDPDTLEAVDVVRDEIKRLSGLVTEFLDFARPRSLDYRRASLGALLTRVELLLSSDASAQKLSIEVDLPSAEVEVEADFFKLEQVLLNLGRNALDAMQDTPGGALTLRLRRRPSTAVITVIDEGGGISGELGRIFDPFYSTKAQGTGLGLSIVHRIISDHGGNILVESEPGATQFEIELPLRRPLPTT